MIIENYKRANRPDYAAPYCDYLASPMGLIEILANNEGLLAINSLEEKTQRVESNSHIELAIQQLEEYFNRQRTVFNLPLILDGGTPFQQQVWKYISDIPFGKTVSYGSIALQMGDMKKVRAVAASTGANFFGIVIPCHRVIGADGALTGYAGGLARKRALLTFEGVLPQMLAL
jgi:O-6-methylguanine DNA methyltransferase